MLAPVHIVQRGDEVVCTWSIPKDGNFRHAIGVARDPYMAIGRAWSEALKAGWVTP